jgi:hypothetical protein
MTPLVLLLLAVPAAMARDEGGNPCVANDSEAGSTMIGLTTPQNAGYFMQPTLWSGVITRWKVPLAAGMAPVAQQLVVFEQVYVEGETRYRKAGESSVETVVPGSNEFATRITLQGEGHHYLGLHGPLETLLCEKQDQAVSGSVLGDFPLGAIMPAEDRVGIGTPVTAIAEPDRDQDGSGDETQDQCERSAATQGGCPTVALSTGGAQVKRGAILLPVSATSEAPVEVSGQVGWAARRKAGRRVVGPGKAGARVTVGLRAEGALTVAPGAPSTFRIPLPKSVIRHLGQLAPRQSLEAKLTATATDLAYRVTTAELTVKLSGREITHRKR